MLLERECLRQRVLHALDALSRCHTRNERHAQAVDAAMAAVAIEPLRESAQRVLIEAHRAEGNAIEARRCYEAYCGLLERELGLEPTAELRAIACGRPAPVGATPAPRGPSCAPARRGARPSIASPTC